MKRLLLLGTSLLLLYSCQRGITGASLFKPANLPSQQITVYTAHDTIVHLPSGTMINIPAHALEGDTVSLTIKEALHITDMISAGLSTRSDGEILSSGGMIFIDGQVKILKPIQVTVIPDKVDPKMQLFMGSMTKSGMNWTNPTALTIVNNNPPIQQPAVFSSMKDTTDTGYDPPAIILNNYSFYINKFGWYNIDKYLMDANSVLKVQLDGVSFTTVTVMLVIPDDKVMLEGYYTKSYYYFKSKDGNLPLPTKKKCYVIAMGEKDSVPVFGMTRFISKWEQNIHVNIQPVNKQVIADSLSVIGIGESIHLK